jgi:hypothetical protein
MKTTTETITPKLAEKYLNSNTNNRPLRSGHAEKMVADMVAGAWTECAMPIVFYEDGTLADGQHRLWAIGISGVAQTFTVIRDFPRKAGVNIDTGIIRNAVDVAHITGLDSSLNNLIVSAARGIEDGQPAMGKRSRTMTEMLAVVAKHKEAAHWVVRNGPHGRGMRNAPVLSAIGRAWYVEDDKDRLAHFSEVMGKGFTNTEDDAAAIAMRNYLIAKMQARSQAASSVNWRDTFIKTQNAVYHFMKRKPLTIIKVVSDEMYPLADKENAPVPTTKRGVNRLAKATRTAKKGAAKR